MDLDLDTFSIRHNIMLAMIGIGVFNSKASSDSRRVLLHSFDGVFEGAALWMDGWDRWMD